jgi:hypothetical protein
MKAKKRVGIWMDHANAHIMEYAVEDYSIATIESKFGKEDKLEALTHGENLLHHKKQQADQAYYKELLEIIKNYDDVLLFGPSNAKTELFNLFKSIPHLNHIKVATQPAEKMTNNQMHAFVTHYFQTVLNYDNSFNK